MKSFMLNSWKVTMDNRYNPLRHLDMASQHYFMHVLAWMWSMVFSLAFLSIFQFQFMWLAHAVIISGVFATVIVFKRAEEKTARNPSNLHLGHGSRCVWQLDREA